MLTKDKILSNKDIKIEKVEVEEWNDHVYIKEFSLKDRLDIEKKSSKDKTGKMAFCQTLVCGLCDKEGTNLFSDDDIDSLAEKSNKVLQMLFQKCIDLNKIGEKTIKESEKN